MTGRQACLSPPFNPDRRVKPVILRFVVHRAVGTEVVLTDYTPFGTIVGAASPCGAGVRGGDGGGSVVFNMERALTVRIPGEI